MNNSKNNSASLLELWDMTIEELNYIVEKNPSLRGMIFGYLAELKLEKLWLRHKSVSLRDKPDDHDRRRKGDRLIVFKGKQFVFESKSLQTNSIARTDEGWVGKAQVDASDIPGRTVHFDERDAPVKRICDSFLPFGTFANTRKYE